MPGSVGYAMLFSIVMGIVGAIALALVGAAANIGKVDAAGADRCNSLFAGGLCRHCARLFNDLSRNCAAVALAIGHGIAAIVRSFGAREGKGDRTAELRTRRGPRRCAECGQLLMAGTIEPPQMDSGAGIYFDGVTSARRDVRRRARRRPACRFRAAMAAALTNGLMTKSKAWPRPTTSSGSAGAATRHWNDWKSATPPLPQRLTRVPTMSTAAGRSQRRQRLQRHRLERGRYRVAAGGRLVRRARDCGTR